MSSVDSICCDLPGGLKRKLGDDMLTAEAFGDFGIKMVQVGLKQQCDGFMKLNEAHQQQQQAMRNENLSLHLRNAELAMENAYLRRKMEEAKVLRALMSMAGSTEEEDSPPPTEEQTAQEEMDENDTTTPVIRPTFASVVAPSAVAKPPAAKRWTWMFQYNADRPIHVCDLAQLYPMFRTIDSVRIGEDSGFYVALAQLSHRTSSSRMIEELLKLSESGVVKEVCCIACGFARIALTSCPQNSLSVELTKPYDMDSWLDMADVANAGQCEGRTALLRYMSGWNKRKAVVCCDGQTVRFPFQKVKV